MYDPVLVEPMRRELTALGVEELPTADEVNQLLENHRDVHYLAHHLFQI